MTAVCVVGMGKLGSCLAALLADRGHRVVGLDLNSNTVDLINEGKAPVREPGLQSLIDKLRESGNLRATTDPGDAVRNSEIAFFVVPTPSDDEGKFTNRYILDALEAMGPYLAKKEGWYSVAVCSTVMPGSTNGPIKDCLEKITGKKVGNEIGLAYSPEFIALGSVIHDMQNPDMVLLGADDSTSRTHVWETLVPLPSENTPFLFLGTTDAEMAKIAINTYVTMKISYANTIAEVCEALPGADAREVLRAVGADSRVGSKYLRPGGAYGGPCFPRDTTAFSALAGECSTRAQLAEATAIINRRQSVRIADRLTQYDRVAILGKSYKPSTPVTECSFALELIQLLQLEGVRVTAYDPLVHGDVYGCQSVDSAQEAVNIGQAIIVATAYAEFGELDFKDKPVVDVWDIVPDAPNVWKVGRG